MSRSTLPTPRSPSRPAPRRPTDAVCVRFVAAGESPLRTYADPRPAVAVVTLVDPVAAVAQVVADEHVLVLRSSDARPSPLADDWVAEPAAADRPRPLVVPLPGGTLTWRAGRGVLAGPIDDADDVLAGLADFAFYESALRQLESAVTEYERTAAADVRLAYRIADADRGQWDRLGRTMEALAELRLTFARLEPRLNVPPQSLPTAGRRAFRRLVARAAVEDRLTAVSDRLEACEALYEGAVDRITDHRWWRRGHRLETIIVVLLAAEGLQLAAELVLHVFQLRGH